MLQTLKNAWNTREIRSKILFTLLILLIYRVGTVIPVPFVEANDFAASLSGTILDYMNTLSGGSLGAMTLFALGVQPYINASIIIQLLAVVFPKLGELGKTDNRFRRWEYDIKPYLKKGANELKGVFASAELKANEIAKGGKSAQRAELCIASGFAPAEALPKA